MTLLARASQRLSRAVSHFRRDERGSVMTTMIFALPVMLVAVGAGADYAELYRAKVTFQNAVDAATLAAAKTLAATGNAQKTTEIGEELFRANIMHLGEKAVREASIVIDTGNGDCATNGVSSVATLPHDPLFNFGFRFDSQKKESHLTSSDNAVMLRANSTVECGNDTIELAMVLDNSGSMGYDGKMGTLRTAAAGLVDTLHATMGARADAIRISLVPFTGTVNVGTANRNASWMDTNGTSPYHWYDEDDNKGFIDPETGSLISEVTNGYRLANGQALSRFTLFDNLPGHSWNGCVEQLPFPYHTQDVEPSSANPETLFVPYFAPDTPDDWTGEKDMVEVIGDDRPICRSWQSKFYYWGWYRYRRTIRRCTRWTDDLRAQIHPTKPNYRPHRDDRVEYRNGDFIGDRGGIAELQPDRDIVEEVFQNDYLDDAHNFDFTSGGHHHSRDNTGTDGGQYDRQRWINKYLDTPTGDGPTVRNATVLGESAGPNLFCDLAPIAELTDNADAAKTAIEQMEARGATNVQHGVAWGWRTLSPGEPFTGGRAYNAADNKKIMIVMTDGNNTYYPTDYFYSGKSARNKSYYGSHGMSVNGRIHRGYNGVVNADHDFSTFTKAMDAHLTTTCTNAKNAGVTIYSIAFDVPNGSSVKATLEECASSNVSGAKLYFDARDNAALTATFERIAEELADLRLSQ